MDSHTENFIYRVKVFINEYLQLILSIRWQDNIANKGILCCIFSLCVLLSLSDFNMLDCTVFCDILVAIVGPGHLFECGEN